MVRLIVYCVLFALVPVVAWFVARHVSRFERRIVGVVLLAVPWGLILFVVLVWDPGHSRPSTQVITQVANPGFLTPGFVVPTLQALPTAPAGGVPPQSVVPVQKETPGGVHQVALGGRPDIESRTGRGSTRPLTPGLTPIDSKVKPVGSIAPPKTATSTYPFETTPPSTSIEDQPAPTGGSSSTSSPPDDHGAPSPSGGTTSNGVGPDGGGPTTSGDPSGGGETTTSGETTGGDDGNETTSSEPPEPPDTPEPTVEPPPVPDPLPQPTISEALPPEGTVVTA